jgi:membrane protein
MIFIGFYIGKSVAASAYGAAGSLVVVIAWIYYSAEFTRVYARTLGSQRNGEDPTNAGRSFGRARQTRRGGILS